jgi:uncharacterized protein (DUF1330 family)
MSAYLVFTRIRTKDQAELDAYFASGSYSEDMPFKVLAGYGKQQVFEGDDHEGMVILEFENAEIAKSWYQSPFYQGVSQHRFKGADYQVTLVEGVARNA